MTQIQLALKSDVDALANGGSIAATAVQIDLCGATYGAAPGTDITGALQEALDWLAAHAPNGGEVYFSKPGTYLIHGAPQTGAAQGYSYNGQILIPAVAEASSMPIRIRGAFRASSGGSTTGAANGVILESNATAGYVFDIVPAFTQFGCPWTGVMPIFEDIVIRCPDNPTCGGLNMLCTQRFRAERVTLDTPTAFTVPASGFLEALVLPQIYNNGDVTLRDLNVRSYPIGIRLSEHNVLDNVFIQGCMTALEGGGASHANWLGYVDVEECATIISGGSAPAFGAPAPVAGTVVYGKLDYENSAVDGLAPAAFVNDTYNNRVIGKLDVWGTISGSYPVIGGSGLDLAAVAVTATNGPYLRGTGWQERHPVDNFKRLSALSGSAAPGQSAPSLHPWRVQAGSFAVSGGALRGLTGADQCYVPVCKAGATDGSVQSGFGLSRAITCKFTLGAASPLLRLYACSAVTTNGVSVSGGGFGIEVKIAGGAACILRANNSNIAGGGPTLAAGSTHTVKLSVYHDATGYPYRAKVYLDGALIIDSVIPASLKGLGLSNPSVYPYYEDGLLFGDTGTTVSLFAVNDISPEPPPNLVTAIPYSASMTPDANQGTYQTVAVTNNTAFTINAPANPPVATQTQDLTVEFLNSSGGAITNVSGATWNAAFVLLGGPLTDPASTKKRFIRFTWNGFKWIETARASADY